MIHIYCGEGKGKTTAAFGLAARAAGSGYGVVIAQFLKGRQSGERETFSRMERVTLLTSDLQDIFSWQMNSDQRAASTARHNELFRQAVSRCGTEKTLVVLDELIGAYGAELIDRAGVLDFLREQGQRENIEIVLTGRDPAPELLELADYVTQMKKIKHPYDRGVQMRKGIEY